MYIKNERGTQIINTDFVERFCVDAKIDAALILASYSTDRTPVVVARYKDEKEAVAALDGLYMALADGKSYYDMPLSLYYAEQVTTRDARIKRKGGS